VNTNEKIYEFFNEAGLSTDHEDKVYKGEHKRLFNVSSDFIKKLYACKDSLNLKFVVYCESKGTVKKFRLLEPSSQKKSKQSLYLRKIRNTKKKLLKS
jgi:hypothetical protein